MPPVESAIAMVRGFVTKTPALARLRLPSFRGTGRGGGVLLPLPLNQTQRLRHVVALVQTLQVAQDRSVARIVEPFRTEPRRVLGGFSGMPLGESHGGVVRFETKDEARFVQLDRERADHLAALLGKQRGEHRTKLGETRREVPRDVVRLGCTPRHEDETLLVDVVPVPALGRRRDAIVELNDFVAFDVPATALELRRGEPLRDLQSRLVREPGRMFGTGTGTRELWNGSGQHNIIPTDHLFEARCLLLVEHDRRTVFAARAHRCTGPHST